MHAASAASAALEAIRRQVAGEVRSDRLTRALYATDASIYQITPDGVVFPKTAADVAAAVQACGRYGVPLTARGAGTGLTGAAVNRGIQLDCSRFLNRIIAIDPHAQTARVEPGVVLDELNAALQPYGLQFAPDVATSSRATVGGMIAVNSCGAHSILYGRTVDHVAGLDVVLADGSSASWGRGVGKRHNPLARRCDELLAGVVDEHADEIAARFPRVLRSNGGYGLDRLRIDNARLNTEAVLCGSEGTLAIVVGATLRLTRLPACRGLLIVQFAALPLAFAGVPAILQHAPAAVELIDDLILRATRSNPALMRRRWFVAGEPAAILVCELFDDRQDALMRRLNELAADLRDARIGERHMVVTDSVQQADVWYVRKAGLGLLMSRPGPRQPYAFVEDTAVAVDRLGEYMRRFDALLREEGVDEAGHYAHASVGCLHVRPILDLRRHDDIERMRRIAERVSSLVAEFGGAMTGEHGDGIVRSSWLAKTYGPRITDAFRRIKETFDPRGILNPGKIVDPLPLTENLRQGADYRVADVQTTLDFEAYGGLAGLAEMCTGVGQCRQRLEGTMCPSYMATGNEQDTPRARANALRVALSNREPLSGLDDPALDDVMDLCISCKACRTECPTGVDIARLKAEWLAHRNERSGLPTRSRLIAASVRMAPWGSHLAPLSNLVMQSRVVRVLMEHAFGLDRRVPPPRFARPTFRAWFARRQSARAPRTAAPWPDVVYFVDTWTNYYLPQVGRATVRVLEALGCNVIVPRTVCCGRPLISKGMLREARALAEHNAAVLAEFADRGMPIVGSEPSCVSVLMDEMPQFVPTAQARRIAAAAQTIETFLARVLTHDPDALRFRTDHLKLLYHGHCHQKALTGTADALAVLKAATHDRTGEIDSGCCGMAGAFGHEVEHYDIARTIGEQRLFPAVRARGEAEIAVSGFSCRQHIEHHTGARPRHVIEYIADALDL